MSKNDFDDWNINSNLLSEPVKTPKIFNTRLNSALFLLSFAALSLFGMVCVYSATYPITFGFNVGDFEFMVRQVIYFAVGLSIGLAVLFLTDNVIKVIGYILMLICLLVLTVNIIALNKNVVAEVSLQLIIFIVLMFFSAFFAKKGNTITRLRDLLVPSIIVISLVFLILYEKNITFAVIFFLLSIVMFACGGVGFGGVLLLVLFAIIPVICIVFSNPSSVNSLLKFFIPGYARESVQINQTFVRLQAISSGGLFGKGIGLGQFKFGNIQFLDSVFILCNIAEETGFAGVFLLIVLFSIFAVTGFRSAMVLNEKNKFASNLLTGLVSHIMLCFVVNILSCLGLLPLNCVSLPFISFGASIIPFTIEAMIIFKYSRLAVRTNGK